MCDSRDSALAWSSPVAAAAGAASLRIIDEEKLVENSRTVGAYFLKKLQPFVDRYPFVGEVRGAGLFLGIELVKDKKTKEPLPRSVTNQIFQENLKRGLLTMSYAASFRIQPAAPARPNRCQLFGPGSRPALFEKMAASAALTVTPTTTSGPSPESASSLSKQWPKTSLRPPRKP